MLSPIDEKYQLSRKALAADVSNTRIVCESRPDLKVVSERNNGEIVAVVITVDQADSMLHEKTIYMAVHTAGKWWNTSFDTRFFQ